MQALLAQSGMSIPIRAPLWISVGGNHLLSEQIDQQQGWSHAGQWPPKPIARLKRWHSGQRRSPTRRSPQLVHRLRRHCPATLELLAEALQVGQAGAVTEAEGMLLMGRASNSVREMRRVPRRIPDSQGHHHHANRHAWTC